MFHRLKAFNGGRKNMEDIERESRPSISITETMRNTAAIITKEGRSVTVRQLHALAVS